MARKDVDAIVSGAGWIGGFADKLSAALRKRGASIGDIHQLVTDAAEAPVGKIADALVEFMGVGNTAEFWRTMEDLAIRIPSLERPTLEELQEKFPWVKSIERDTSPTEAVTLRLGTILRRGEDRVSSSEYEARLASGQSFLLGYQHAVWLVEHQDEYPAFMALLGKLDIDFWGLVVVDEHGSRNFPCLRRVGWLWSMEWPWGYMGKLWATAALDRNGRVASK